MRVTLTRPLQYSVEDAPPIHITILLGFQQFLTMMGGSIAMPLIVAEACCVGPDLVGRAQIMGTLMFVDGIATLMQIFLGVRLPIVQGASFAFVVPMMAMQRLEGRQCPSDDDYATLKVVPGSEEHRNLWMSRLVEIQGAILMAGVLEAVIGSLGLVSFIFRYVGPLTMIPTMSLIEMSLVNEIIGEYASTYWPVSLLAMGIVLVSTVFLQKVTLPIPVIPIADLIRKRQFKCHVARLRIFSLFPVLLAIAISWSLYAILQYYDVIHPEVVTANVNVTGKLEKAYAAELAVAQWFRLPYPGQWGLPEINLAVTVGMFAAVFSSVIESIGDYCACARMCGVPMPPPHAMNRGIAVEGLGCIVAGAFGCGPGVSSYAENVGAIGITGVASRRVIFVTSLVLIFLGCFTKLATCFVMIPEPVIGGILITILSMVIAVGFSNLQFVDLNSSRNLLIFGLSIFLGLGIPTCIKENPDFINTRYDVLDEVITVLLSTGMFVGGVVGFFLDNTVPKDPYAEEIPNIFNFSKNVAHKTYELPIKVCGWIKRVHFFRFVPISPTFEHKLLWNLICPPCCRKKCSRNAPGSSVESEIPVVKPPEKSPVATLNVAFERSLTGSLVSLSFSSTDVPVVSSSMPKSAPLAFEEKWTDF